MNTCFVSTVVGHQVVAKALFRVIQQSALGALLVCVFSTAYAANRLENISTRGPVGTGDDVMIGGLIIEGDTDKTVVIRARGPSLAAAGLLVICWLIHSFT